MTVNVEYNQLDPLLRATVSPEGDVNDPKTGALLTAFDRGAGPGLTESVGPGFGIPGFGWVPHRAHPT